MQYLLILPSTLFFAATIYMAPGRIAKCLNATHHLPMGERWLTKIFVVLDILCFCVVMSGAGMESTTSAQIGEIEGKVGTAGLVSQVVVTAFFVTGVGTFYLRLIRRPTRMTDSDMGWSKCLVVLYVECLAIAVRNIMRTVQEIQEFYGYINGHEIFLYMLDASMMALLVWSLAFLYPGKLIRAVEEAGKSEQDDLVPMAQMNHSSQGSWRGVQRVTELGA